MFITPGSKLFDEGGLLRDLHIFKTKFSKLILATMIAITQGTGDECEQKCMRLSIFLFLFFSLIFNLSSVERSIPIERGLETTQVS